MRNYWKSMMVRLAKSNRAKRWAQSYRPTSSLAVQFVAGATAAAGVLRAAALLTERGIFSSLCYLGGKVDRQDLVEENLRATTEVARRLSDAKLGVHVSVDPSQLGFHLDPMAAETNLARIAELIGESSGNRTATHLLVLGMEHSSMTDATLAIRSKIAERRAPVGITLQAYLRRTEDDLVTLIRQGATVRMVKGAYAVKSHETFADDAELQANWRLLIGHMLSRAARDSGFRPIIATHDDKIHSYTRKRAAANGWKSGEYEIEMLLGVRSDVARDLAVAGERVRLYLPFGCDWFPYAMRRIS